MVALGALVKGRQRLDETLSFSEGQGGKSQVEERGPKALLASAHQVSQAARAPRELWAVACACSQVGGSCYL